MKHQTLHTIIILIGFIFVLSFNAYDPSRAYGVGLTDEFTYLQEPWFPQSYKGTRNIQSYLAGYNITKFPHDSVLLDQSSVFLAQSELIVTRKKWGDNNSNPEMLLSQINSDSGSILALAVGTIAFLYVMPESFSKWPEEKKDLSPNKLWERYEKNVKNGPVWDHDEWEVNYIGHPYFGAAYYTHAKNKNFNRLESLSYSFMMSTCLYEYGLEAFFEDPSIQDLIITPVVGSLFGEVFIKASDSIENNGDKVLGSKILGSVCLFMLDPISATLSPINAFNERYSKMQMDTHFYSKSVKTTDDVGEPGAFYDHRIGVEISITTNMFSL